MKGDWNAINLTDFLISLATSMGIGLVRLLQLLRKGHTLRWFDAIFEPAIAVTAGMLVWGLLYMADVGEVFRTALVSLGAYGGPHTITLLEKKYLGTDSSKENGK
jgi:hypothetical protein